jgi:hypothetical protein
MIGNRNSDGPWRAFDGARLGVVAHVDYVMPAAGVAE